MAIKQILRRKLSLFLEYLSGLKGNLLMGGTIHEVFSFNCETCESLIKKPIKHLSAASVVNCINPDCKESYFLEQENDEQDFKITRRIFKFNCKSCKHDVVVPTNTFRKLKFDEQLNIHCSFCHVSLTVIMRPLVKENAD